MFSDSNREDAYYQQHCGKHLRIARIETVKYEMKPKKIGHEWGLVKRTEMVLKDGTNQVDVWEECPPAT